MVKQLRNNSVIKPDECESQARQSVDQSAVARNFGRNTFLNPEPESIEAPRCGPTDQGPKYDSVDDPAERSKAGSVIIRSQKANAGGAWSVLPIARANLDQGFWILRPEFER